MYPGLPSRLEKEIKQLYLMHTLEGDKERLKASRKHECQNTMQLTNNNNNDNRNSKYTLKIHHVVNIWSF
jgi:hypothetical protein